MIAPICSDFHNRVHLYHSSEAKPAISRSGTRDHTQRLNPHALLGAQRADVGSIRATWTVQDKLALDADEEKTIELKRELVNGQERTVWNPSLSNPARELDFTDAEVARLKAAIETWDHYGVAADRRWLDPLLRDLVSGDSE
jgi:hypothetical protein